MATENVAGVEKFAPAAASLAVDAQRDNVAREDESQDTAESLEKTGNPDVLGEKLGRISAGEINPDQGEIQPPKISSSGRNYNWNVTQEELTKLRVMKYKQGRYYKSRETYRSGKQHDKHICAVAPIYETKNSHKAKAASAAYARQRKPTAGRTRQQRRDGDGHGV